MWHQPNLSRSEKIDNPSTICTFGCVSQLCFSTRHVAIGVLKGNRGNNILQRRGIKWSTQCLCEKEKKMVKIHRMRKGINCRIYYTASTVPRTGKVRLLVWHAVWQSMGPLGVHSERNQGFKMQNGQIHTTNLWWLPCITVHICVPWQHVWACFCGIRHSSHWPISFFEFRRERNAPMLLFTRLFWPLIQKT